MHMQSWCWFKCTNS